MEEFEIERRAANVIEVQFDTIAAADEFAAWLDISGRALFVQRHEHEQPAELPDHECG